MCNTEKGDLSLVSHECLHVCRGTQGSGGLAVHTEEGVDVASCIEVSSSGEVMPTITLRHCNSIASTHHNTQQQLLTLWLILVENQVLI